MIEELKKFLYEQGFIECAGSNTFRLSLNNLKDKFLIILNRKEQRLILACKTQTGRDFIFLPFSHSLDTMRSKIKSFCYKWL
ncbi:MAG: hypothetical protein R3321_00015 [Nitrososphaeraceae archaeon]|nr:hypothetical protein [Nitrososphaeraceae archaeon]